MTRSVAATSDYIAGMTTALITSDPTVMLGKPCIAGTRVTVEYVLELLEDGHGVSDIITEHPHLTREGIAAAIAFAREAVRNTREDSAAK